MAVRTAPATLKTRTELPTSLMRKTSRRSRSEAIGTGKSSVFVTLPPPLAPAKCLSGWANGGEIPLFPNVAVRIIVGSESAPGTGSVIVKALRAWPAASGASQRAC